MEILLDKVGKRFSDQFILKNVDIRFHSGKIYGVKGPNGSGKSTLLRMICGHMSHTKGEIQYLRAGASIKRSDVASHIIYAAPYIDLIDDYNMAEMVQFHTSFRKLLIPHELELFKKELDYPKIKTHQSIKFYSSGMKQRLQLCLSLLTETDVLLLDEPTSYLDESGAQWVQRLLNKYRGNKTVIIASNDDGDFAQCDEVVSITPWSVI